MNCYRVLNVGTGYKLSVWLLDSWFTSVISLFCARDDVANVNAIQDKIVVKPLSAFQGKAVPSKPTADAAL